MPWMGGKEIMEKKIYELSAKMYQAAGGQQGAPNPDDFAGYQQDAGNAGNAAGGQYYDADYTVVDDDNK